ncbi:unnamed protein product [Haemonchus placei]|uniref:Reverse transcriptase domain-containing protein n=1 Tax=Haemonchus placei TaxID=6290 RepID=A0A0N4W210_HAEPC|nr:unnamed protein product [Haemonchus placei]
MPDWAEHCDIPLNLNKSMTMHFGDSQATAYLVNDARLAACQSIKDLGVSFDSKFKFSLHIEQAVEKAFRNLFALFRNVQSSDVTLLKRLRQLASCRMSNIAHRCGAHLPRKVSQKLKGSSVFSRVSCGIEMLAIVIIYPVMMRDSSCLGFILCNIDVQSLT